MSQRAARFLGIVVRILRLFSVPKGNPQLNLAQFEAFSKQVPLLYFILMTNMAALSWTHASVAPFWLVTVLPALFGTICMARTISWVLRRKQKVTAEQAYRRLCSTNRLAAPIAIYCTGWSIMLLPYGDAYQQAHVAFFMAITVIGIIFCLMHLRSAALTVAICVNGPFLVAMLMLNQPTFIATGINVALVTVAMIAILLTHYRDFRQLNESRLVLLSQQEALHEQNRAMKTLSDENMRLANLDSLTLLGNRRSFFHMLDAAFEEARQHGTRLAVGVIDLDGFKPINDMYGHAAGDKVLVEVSRRLTERAIDGLSVFRLGGDEFALLHDAGLRDKELNDIGEALCAVIAQPIFIGSGNVQVTGSLGFASYPDVGLSGHDLYECADYALYAAKRYKRAGVVIFNASQAKSLDRQKEIEEVLMAADLETELFLAFQPIVHVESRRCIGFEALARWNSRVLGPVSPGEFIPIAEHNGRINLITHTLLAQALQQARRWPDETFLSFNLSPHDLSSVENVMRIIAAVHASGVEPVRINFEITETAVIRDFEQAAASIEMLRRLGAGISLDDFGTGYSSLNHVHKLPLSKIKIDGSFVSHIDQQPASAKIIRSVLSLCSELGLGAIVEGVETPEELAVLEAIGVQYVQGFHFSKPLPADQALALVTSQRLDVGQKAAS